MHFLKDQFYQKNYKETKLLEMSSFLLLKHLKTKKRATL